LTDGENKNILSNVKWLKGGRSPEGAVKMKSWMMVLLAALCAGTVMAQSRNGKQKQGK
jgi:hypothetical protein